MRLQRLREGGRENWSALLQVEVAPAFPKPLKRDVRQYKR